MNKLLTIIVLVLSLSLLSNIFAQDKKGEMKSDTTKTSGKQQQFCPVMGGKIDTTLYYDYKGERVYVCCKMCLKKIKENPQKYIDKLKKEGVILKKVEKK